MEEGKRAIINGNVQSRDDKGGKNKMKREENNAKVETRVREEEVKEENKGQRRVEIVW